MTADLLNTEITDLATLESLPIGAGVVDDCGDLFQRIIDGDWYRAGSDEGAGPGQIIPLAPLRVVWLPREANV